MTTPDPTTRDPAASLRACIELAAKATPGEWEVLADLCQPHADIRSDNDGEMPAMRLTVPDARAIAAAVNFLRDDAPALLAEVEELRAARDAGADLDCDDRRNDADFWWTVAAFRGVELSRQITEREAAEAALRESVALLRDAREPVAHMAANVTGRLGPEYAKDDYALVRRITTFLAHHGARTGESND